MRNAREQISGESILGAVQSTEAGQVEIHEPRRRTTKKIRQLTQMLIGWGLLSSSVLPGLESALQRRPVREEEKTEQLDPTVSRNEDNLRYLRALYGTAIVDRISPDSSFYRAQAARDELPAFIYRGRQEGQTLRPDPEKDCDLPADQLQEVFIGSYPRGLVDANIGIIVLEPGRVDSAETERAAGGQGQALGHIRGSVYGASEYLFESNLAAALETHGHEIGHTIDWERNTTMSVNEKAELWRRVSERCLRANNLYTSSHLDSLRPGDSPPEIARKVAEYWAEICSQYFQHPGLFRREHPADYNLVHDWIKKQDPEFNPFAAARERQKLVAENRLTLETKDLPPDLQHDLERVRQDWLARHNRETVRKNFGFFDWQTADVDRVASLCQAYGLPPDGRRDLRIVFALWGSFDYQTRYDLKP